MRQIKILIFLVIGINFITHGQFITVQENEYKVLADDEYNGNILKIVNNFKFYPIPFFRYSNRLDTIQDDNIYFGLFEVENKLKEKVFILKKLNVKIIQVEKYGPIEDDFYSDNEQTPIFLFRGLNQQYPFVINGKYIKRFQLYPGDNFYFKTKKAEYFIYVTGTPEFKDTIGFADFAYKIENVELHIQERVNNTFQDTVLFRVDMHQWPMGGFEGSIGIQWIGDLDADGKLDMILGFNGHYSYYDHFIYLSSLGNYKILDKYRFSD